jgi:long-chain acyl-CoA synthetase
MHKLLRPAHVYWPPDELSAPSPHHERGQTYMVFGPEAPLTGLWDVYESALKHAPGVIAVVDETGKRRVSYSALLSSAAALQVAFRNEFNLKSGDRVVVVGRNSPEWIIVFVAATWMGLVCVPMNSWWTPSELEYGVLDSQAKVVFADDERVQRLARSSALSGVRVIGMEPSKHSNVSDMDLILERFAGGSVAAIKQQPHVDSAACIMYTSGTTGHPKGVVLTHRAMCHTLNFYALASAASSRYEDVAQKVVLLSVPLFHATGLFAVLLSSFISGRRMVLMRKWQVDDALRLIDKEKVTQVTGVPTMLLELLNSPNLHKYDTSSLRAVGGGGAPMPAGLASSVTKTFKKSSPGQGYGLTETSAVSTMIGSTEYLAHPSSCGRALPGVEIEIWGENNHQVLATGKEGRVMIRGPNVMREYWRQREATAKAITKDGWFDSGDIGKFDAEGFLYITDRAKDMIIRGGENISCRAVEEAVYAKLGELVAECAVFGYPHPTLGEEVGLALQFKPKYRRVGLKEIREACEKVLAGYELPTGLAVFENQLPRGATGKLVKKAIKEMLKEGKLENWQVWQGGEKKAKL